MKIWYKIRFNRFTSCSFLKFSLSNTVLSVMFAFLTIDCFWIKKLILYNHILEFSNNHNLYFQMNKLINIFDTTLQKLYVKYAFFNVFFIKIR